MDKDADDEREYRQKMRSEPAERRPRPRRSAERPPGANMSRTAMGMM